MSTAFHDLKKFFNANNVVYSAWTLRKQTEQEFDGDVIVIGSLGDGPYTQFCFNENGDLVEAASICDEATKQVAIAIDSVGGRTRTEYDFETDETTTTQEE